MRRLFFTLCVLGLVACATEKPYPEMVQGTVVTRDSMPAFKLVPSDMILVKRCDGSTKAYPKTTQVTPCP